MRPNKRLNIKNYRLTNITTSMFASLFFGRSRLLKCSKQNPSLFFSNKKMGPYKRTQIAALLFYPGGAAVEECRSRRGMNLVYHGILPGNSKSL